MNDIGIHEYTEIQSVGLGVTKAVILLSIGKRQNRWRNSLQKWSLIELPSNVANTQNLTRENPSFPIDLPNLSSNFIV